jgi:hypothetical protein
VKQKRGLPGLGVAPLDAVIADPRGG